MTDLLSPTDPDYAAFNTGDTTFLLKSVGDTIRDYCGWHISPSVTETLDKLPVGGKGILMLPSRYVTAVTGVTLYTNDPMTDGQLLPTDSYVWHQGGWVEPVGGATFRSDAGYYYEPGPVFTPSTNRLLASVDLVHGYATLPTNVKRVAYELAGWATALGPDSAGGDIKEIKSPGFALSLGGVVSLGMNLNPDQKARLANYKLESVK